MPVGHESIVNLPGFQVLEALQWNPLHLRVRYEGKQACPHCQGTRLRQKDRFERRIRHESVGTRACFLFLQGVKYQCLDCRAYFHSRFPGILPYQRSSEAFRTEVSEQHHHGITQKALSTLYHIGNATIERWYQRYLQLFLQEYQDRRSPRILGIDEHFFTRKQGYATTFADLSKHRVYDVTLGRSEKALEGFLRKLKEKERTKVVVMDLSETYRSIARKYFPKAQIVADRFHVIRWVNHQFLKAWQQLDPHGRKNRGLLSLMRRHEENLSEGQRTTLRRYLQGHGVLEAIYDFKQDLCRLLKIKHQRADQCRHHIPTFLSMIEQLKQAPIEALSSLGRTLENWKEEIVRMWRFTKTNSITEGLHNKMEMISRRAFGFRNFNNYRNRVRVLCG